MASALAALRDDGMEIRSAKANFWQTRLDDGFLWLEMDLLVGMTAFSISSFARERTGREKWN